MPDTSSAFGRRDVEISTFINENHMNMCRFKSVSDPAYVDFKANLLVYLSGIAMRATKKSENEDKLRAQESRERNKNKAGS